jgi:hypothetical protein
MNSSCFDLCAEAYAMGRATGCAEGLPFPLNLFASVSVCACVSGWQGARCNQVSDPFPSCDPLAPQWHILLTSTVSVLLALFVLFRNRNRLYMMSPLPTNAPAVGGGLRATLAMMAIAVPFCTQSYAVVIGNSTVLGFLESGVNVCCMYIFIMKMRSLNMRMYVVLQ